MPPRGQRAMVHDALLDLGLLDQRRALGTIDHVDGPAADHGAASGTGRQFCQGHSHRHRLILKRFRPATTRDRTKASNRVMVPASPPDRPSATFSALLSSQ
jgi:hypothetical protein